MEKSCVRSPYNVELSQTTLFRNLQILKKYLWIEKGVLWIKTFNVKVQVQNVPELWRQTFWKVLLFLWNVTYFVFVITFKIYTIKTKRHYEMSLTLCKTSKCKNGRLLNRKVMFQIVKLSSWFIKTFLA